MGHARNIVLLHYFLYEMTYSEQIYKYTFSAFLLLKHSKSFAACYNREIKMAEENSLTRNRESEQLWVDNPLCRSNSKNENEKGTVTLALPRQNENIVRSVFKVISLKAPTKYVWRT